MKEFIVNNFEIIFTIISAIVTFILGKVTKKVPQIDNSNIPIQNIIILIISTLVYYFATGDWSLVVASGSPIATLVYDLIHNYNKDNITEDVIENTDIKNND